MERDLPRGGGLHGYDGYRGQYGIEDTRKALIEAKQKGVHGLFTLAIYFTFITAITETMKAQG
ncbi:MAG TPA: hypothetical protein ENI80_01895 [Acidiferrobacteraceae bacterium]|nr:hypothetical protein [Acidiferrobacteraceae bacterium]